jgi:hypothetical protein
LTEANEIAPLIPVPDGFQDAKLHCGNRLFDIHPLSGWQIGAQRRGNPVDVTDGKHHGVAFGLGLQGIEGRRGGCGAGVMRRLDDGARRGGGTPAAGAPAAMLRVESCDTPWIRDRPRMAAPNSEKNTPGPTREIYMEMPPGSSNLPSPRSRLGIRRKS